MGEMKKELGNLVKFLGNSEKEYPEQTKAFFNFLGAVEKDGKLSHKTKEIISLAIAVATKCKGCIAYHTHEALKAGATKDEIMEAAYVAVAMSGGPGLVYCQYVADAIKEFKK